MGTINTSLFANAAGAVRNENGKYYLDRNITLIPTNNASAKIRFYVKTGELAALQAADPSITSAADLKITKTSSACQSVLSGTPTVINQSDNAAYGSDFYLQFLTPSFSSFYIDGLTGALPVSITDYSAVCNNGNVIVSWITASEINNKFFTVEKSRDGTSFETLITASGEINSLGNKKYSVTDLHPFENKTYYRLKQTDNDGKEQYFKILIAACGDNNKAIALYPNPVSDELLIEMNKDFKKGKIKIFSASGAFIKESAYSAQAGSIIRFNTQSFSKGIYLLQIVNEKEQMKVLKFVKQ